MKIIVYRENEAEYKYETTTVVEAESVQVSAGNGTIFVTESADGTAVVMCERRPVITAISPTAYRVEFK